MQPQIWWFGHCGFAIQYYDILFHIDTGINGQPDLILATQAKYLPASPACKVVLPNTDAEDAKRAGIDYSQMTTTAHGLRVEYFKNGVYARIYAVRSEPQGLGYLIRCQDTTIYHAGDSQPYEGLADFLRPYNVTVALVPTTFASSNIETKWVVPMNYSTEEELQPFLNHLLFHRPEQRFKLFQPGESWQPPCDS